MWVSFAMGGIIVHIGKLEYEIMLDDAAIKILIENMSDLRNIIKECTNDAKQLGLSKRQIKKLFRTISVESSSYRKHIRTKTCKIYLNKDE